MSIARDIDTEEEAKAIGATAAHESSSGS